MINISGENIINIRVISVFIIVFFFIFCIIIIVSTLLTISFFFSSSLKDVCQAATIKKYNTDSNIEGGLLWRFNYLNNLLICLQYLFIGFKLLPVLNQLWVYRIAIIPSFVVVSRKTPKCISTSWLSEIGLSTIVPFQTSTGLFCRTVIYIVAIRCL